MGSKGSRRLWTEKLTAGGGKIFNAPAAMGRAVSVAGPFCGVVAGFDASLRGTGVAVVDCRKSSPRLLFSTRITCHPRLSFFQCLGKISTDVSAIVEKFPIDGAAIEQTVYVQNHRVAHTLGAVRGVIVAILVNASIPIAEYAPLRIKQSITGIGRASKEQVRRMVCGILKPDVEISHDESDAMATALCHAWTRAIVP
jgi:crossover junction endodeoxyribonuclease RuvC